MNDDTPAPVAQPLSAEELHDLRLVREGGDNWGSSYSAEIIDRLLATLDAARSVPDNAALRALQAIDALEPPDPLGWSADYRLGWWSARKEARIAVQYAAPVSPAGLDVERLRLAMDRAAVTLGDARRYDRIAREYAALASPELAAIKELENQ